jgi:hypothetical protein
MTTTRKQYSPKLKTRMVVEAIWGEKTTPGGASDIGEHCQDFYDTSRKEIVPVLA